MEENLSINFPSFNMISRIWEGSLGKGEANDKRYTNMVKTPLVSFFDFTVTWSYNDDVISSFHVSLN